ncbi:MAG: hypothetical protein VYA30_02265 [Myxococcota bacterium]|nr:hypothetical protein [Myxococcota bacterium]
MGIFNESYSGGLVTVHFVWRILLYVCLLVTIGACSTETEPKPPLVLDVVIPMNSEPGLEKAASDLKLAARSISGSGQNQLPTAVVYVTIINDSEAIAEQGYRLDTSSRGVELSASSHIGAMYGLYQIAGDLGARYIHPEQTIYPSNPLVEMPAYSSGEATHPHFEMRGFHEHTQHPTVMSDYLLRPNVDSFRSGVSRYFRWLARNRQNQLTFHMLNTVDLEAWIPYMQSMTTEALEYGIKVGVVIGFVDQQQNAFRLVKPQEVDPETGESIDAEVQITTKLDRFASTGIELLGFQIGTSEFTKPDEQVMLNWLNLATEHLSVNHPFVKPFAWIHTTCGLDRDTGAGGPYYHLPLEADERLGAFVHTTMFYDLEHPAPVYDCEDFQHQRHFFDAANGTRDLVYFPETAWWLGFDNNLPMITPIAARSRQYDVDTVLPAYTTLGHVTFTTGREWTYWQYDHYLTQLTWDGEISWANYLDWLGPIYQDSPVDLVHIFKKWTDFQWRDFYESEPELYFYLAGELPQDELGAAAGIIARPTKPSFKSIVALSDEAFDEWQTGPFQSLVDMERDYGLLLNELPEQMPDKISAEAMIALRVSHLRIAHTLALYRGTSAVRSGDKNTAEAELNTAREITERVKSHVQSMESLYRYPIELLATDKPESLTTYPFGYLAETRTAFFWTRRDDQLSALIESTFNPPEEAWTESLAHQYRGESSELQILIPDSPLLATLLGGFVPNLLLAVASGDVERAILAQDRNANDQPDVGTQQELMLTKDAESWRASSQQYRVDVVDDGGALVGNFEFIRPEFQFFGSDVGQFDSFDLTATVSSANIQSIVSPFGIEPDALGEILKTIWGLDASEPLPQFLPLRLSVPLEAFEQ